MSSREYQIAYKRRRRLDPEYAQRSREQSLDAKRRRKGICTVCGGETRYNGHTVVGTSEVCGKCHRARQHEGRKWTQERIMRAFKRFRAETGRVPRCSDVTGLCESQVLRLSGRRIREIEQVRELGLVLPPPQMVRREFGSWAAALTACGLATSRGGARDHRKEWPA